MNSIFLKPIDYSLINEYDLEMLLKNIILPYKKYDFFTEIFTCAESCLDSFSKDSIKQLESDKNEILFFLSDFEIKYSLFCLINKKRDDSLEIFFSKLLLFAKEKEASDIHIESLEKCFSIRFRIFGKLKTFLVYEKELFTTLSIFVKLKSKLDITQSRLPQNGRFSISIKDEKLDFRVSTMPTISGESVVIRLLNESNVKKDFKQIGFTKKNVEIINKAIESTSGLILVTGPTGSGKTTTLYSLLNELNTNKKKIVTIEDPVEYKIEGIQQISINNEINLSFNKVLKDVLRQDPDVILIGEIRDEESLNIALQASLTGHLVLSTLHTNDSISTIHRLFDLNAKPYLVANTLKTIISQRLILKKCVCLNGCSICNFTNFNGRVMVSEVLNIDEKLSELILTTSSYSKISKYLETLNFKTISDDALKKVSHDITTADEITHLIK